MLQMLVISLLPTGPAEDNNTKMSNTLSNLRAAQKDLINDFMRELIDESVFLGETIPLSPVQGTNYGYTSGGNDLAPPLKSDVIDKFPFASSSVITYNVGDLTISKDGAAGQSSTVSGYTSGGYSIPAGYLNIIDKFPFAADANATDVGDLTVARIQVAGQSSTVSGYSSGAGIDKFPFAADANSTSVGNLAGSRSGTTGQSSTISGYNTGGYVGPITQNVIDKFPFSSDANATDVGDLTVARRYPAGQSSQEYGYSSGGWIPPSVEYFTIDKFPFASDANATFVGSLTYSRFGAAGQSSDAHGYASGGTNGALGAAAPPVSNLIDKFPFASDASATDVGDLSVVRYLNAGQQY